MSLQREYLCPVCGYGYMPEAAHHLPSGLASDEICSCCGIQWGYDDSFKGYAELRALWVSEGMGWQSGAAQVPEGWDGRTQLNALVNGSAVTPVPELPPVERGVLRDALRLYAPQAMPLLARIPGRLALRDVTVLRDAVSLARWDGQHDDTGADGWRPCWQLQARLELSTLSGWDPGAASA